MHRKERDIVSNKGKGQGSRDEDQNSSKEQENRDVAQDNSRDQDNSQTDLAIEEITKDPDHRGSK